MILVLQLNWKGKKKEGGGGEKKNADVSTEVIRCFKDLVQK